MTERENHVTSGQTGYGAIPNGGAAEGEFYTQQRKLRCRAPPLSPVDRCPSILFFLCPLFLYSLHGVYPRACRHVCEYICIYLDIHIYIYIYMPVLCVSLLSVFCVSEVCLSVCASLSPNPTPSPGLSPTHPLSLTLSVSDDTEDKQ